MLYTILSTWIVVLGLSLYLTGFLIPMIEGNALLNGHQSSDSRGPLVNSIK